MQREEANILQDAVGRCCEERFCAKVCAIRQKARPADVAEAVLGKATSQEIADLVSRCALCGLCTQACPNGVDGREIMKYARYHLVEKGVLDPEAYRHLWIDYNWNVLTLFRERYGLNEAYRPWAKERCTVVFMPSCMLANESPELARRAAEWLTDRGEEVMLSVQCCGAMLDGIGVKERGEKYSQELWDRILRSGAKRVVTVCPMCQKKMQETSENDDVTVVSLFQLMTEAGVQVPVSDYGRVTVHDSCGDRQGRVGSHVRALLKNHTLVEMQHYGKNSICCGSGGLVSAIDPELSLERARQRIQEVEEVKADTCITYCMGCAHRLTGTGTRSRIRHILELIFNVTVDHREFDAKAQALFEGEQGPENYHLLQNSRLSVRPDGASSQPACQHCMAE